MRYTVNQLATLSQVSIRTLHFYDEIELLKPAYYGENNYRYYEEEQLLLLQQILFFRELDVPLDEIKKIILSSDFDKINSLQSHKKLLQQKIQHQHTLIATIDQTIEHLQGATKMQEQDFFYGFDSETQKQHEKHLVESQIVTQEVLDECNQKIATWTNQEKNDFINEIERIMTALIAALESNTSVADATVQTLMQQHYNWLQRTWNPTKQRYLELVELYQTPGFKEFYDRRHPKLLTFMLTAMRVFAEKLL